MELPKTLLLRGSSFWLDGGTTHLNCTDEAEQSHTVMLVQRAFTGGNTFGIPGRLYFDGELVPLRSDVESQLLGLLRVAEVRYMPPTGEPTVERIKLSPNALILGEDIKQVLTRGPEDNIRGLRDTIVEFVASPRYESFAAEVEKASKQAEPNGAADQPGE
jgi:hypothetical protein